MAFVEGYIAGLALIVLIGPVLFVLVQSTLERGRTHGFAVAFGIFVSDIVAVLLCTLGLARTLEAPEVRPYLALAGGLLLLGMGLRYLVAPTLTYPEKNKLSGASLAGFFAKGFLVNFVNPFVFMVWIGIIGAATARHGYSLNLAWFLCGAVLAILSLDSAKVILAHRIRPLLRPRYLKAVFRFCGLLLAGFGVRLVVAGVAVWS